MREKPLPPLATDTAYRVEDFQRFEYFGAALTGSEAILRLHLTNGTTLDLPTTETELRHLLLALCDAMPEAAANHLKMRGWL